MSVMKVTVDSTYKVTDIEDTSFLVTGASNVDYIELYVPGTTINKVTVGFLRQDGKKITPVLMTLQTAAANNNGVEVFEYCLDDDDRVLAIAGALQMSFVMSAVDANANTTKTYATEYITASVRLSVASDPDEVTELEALEAQVINNQATYQAQITTNTNNIATNTADITSLKTRVTTAEGKISTLETAETDQESRISTLETAETDHETRIAATETTNATQNTRLATLESTSSSQGTILTSVSERVTTLETDNVNNKADIVTLKADDASHTTTLANHETRITTNTSDIAALQSSITGWQYATPVDSYADLPQPGADFTIYLVRDATDPAAQNNYLEYVWIAESSIGYECLGEHTVTAETAIDNVVADSSAPVKSSGIYTAIEDAKTTLNASIATNTTAIAANTASIATNTASISSLSARKTDYWVDQTVWTIATTDWIASTAVTGTEAYADISVTGLVKGAWVSASFDPETALSGEIAPFVDTLDGTIRVYAITTPTAAVKIVKVAVQSASSYSIVASLVGCIADSNNATELVGANGRATLRHTLSSGYTSFPAAVTVTGATLVSWDATSGTLVINAPAGGSITYSITAAA